MASKNQNIKKPKRDRTNENFGKCVKSVIKRTDNLWWKYQADVYLLVRRKGKIYIYDTGTGSFWMPTQEDIVSARATSTHTQFINARRLSRKGYYHCSTNTFPTVDPDLLQAHTKFQLVAYIPLFTISLGFLVG
jgi:hypothetical protein